MNNKSLRTLFSLLLAAVFVFSLPWTVYAEAGESVTRAIPVYDDGGRESWPVETENDETVAAAAVDGTLSAHVAGSNLDYQRYTVAYGGSATLAVEASGSGTLRYSWARNNNDYTDYTPLSETGNRLAVTNITEGANYTCRISDAAGNSVSISFRIEVENHLEFSFYCNDTLVTENRYYAERGESVVIRAVVTADDMRDLSYTWIDNNNGFQVIAGATTDTITVDSITEGRSYSLNVTDHYGNKLGKQIRIGIQNHLSVKPLNNQTTVFTAKNTSAHLAVQVTGDDLTGITYQWSIHIPTGENSFSVEPIEGATGPYYDTGAINSAQNYSCEVLDRYGNLERTTITASVQNHLTLQSADGLTAKTVPYGGDAALSILVSADDMTGVSYAWYHMEPYGENRYIPSGPVEGATATSCIVHSVTEDSFILAEVIDRYGTRKAIMFRIEIGNGPNVTYSWAADNSSVTASYGGIQETVSTYRTVTKRPTENNAGAYAITSMPFQNSAFTVQSKTGFTIPALKNLKVLRLPADLLEIGESAFEDTSIQAIIVPSGCRRIDPEAFRNCGQLIYVQLMSHNTTIAEETFGSDVLIDFVN